ncbi:MAG: PD-(D/E)XK nuclease family protein [Treponema sp.]|nr:PD-(D/E)XK nuclease family protein [Treponema sp.]
MVWLDFTAQRRFSQSLAKDKDIIAFYNKYMKMPWLTPDRDGGSGDWEGEDGEKFRHDKTIIHAKQVGADGENYPGVIRVMGNAKPEVWCGEVLSFIRTLKEKNILRNYNQIAVLSYSIKNTNVRNLAHCLEENGIPTFSPRSDMFFERREVRLVIGFFMFIFPSLVTDVLKPKEEYRTADDVYAYYEGCAKFFGDEVRADREKHKGLILFATQKFKELSHLTRNTDYAFADLFYQTMQFPLFRELLGVRLDSGVQDLRPAYNLAKLSYTAFSRAQNLLVLSDPDSRERLGQYRRQLEIYAKIIHERTGKEISRLNLFYTGTTDENPFISYKYEDSSVEKAIRDVTDVVHRIEKKDFAPREKCPAAQCKNCDFKFYCGKNV